MHGEGILDNGRNFRYQGSFFDGFFHGYGELTESKLVVKNAKKDQFQKVETTIYKGSWKRGKRDGKG
jgi:hypothetical protein